MSIALRCVILGWVLLFISCSPKISLFDQYAYTQVTSIKVDALTVMSDAVDSFALHKNEVRAVDISIRKMIEYGRHRLNDTSTIRQWEKLNDPKQHLYGGFINRWKQKNKLDSAFVTDQQYIIARAFDQIAELESGKIKPSDIK
ncbi:hypothetical protein EON73_03030 [bacterium]|nr:MAG: hypothetical protein EON73_03030 [bacterium]